MKLARVATPDGMAFVAVEGEQGAEVVREIAEHPFGDPTFTGRSWPLSQTRLLAPILAGKVIAIGKNYADHAAEMGSQAPADPVIFLKPNTSIVGPGVPIVRPRVVGDPDGAFERVDYEGELAVVIGRPCRNVKAADAAGVILGYTVANDVTARDQQRHDGQWTRAKSHDTFCPLGPWIETTLDPSDLALTTTLDGQTRQSGRTSAMIHDIGAIVEWISAVMTLLPGDVILTGTPAGIGPMTGGQSVSVTIEGIGTLTNPVVDK
ncbi:fumarylacetoacetate hydrolase family protein [Gordonia phosphorivorans]|uniref:Fumarylacetoacetate hydrolase family protein n=1 Tax=Gordonia phosphorivorans TaxID=1056982 RepID=A0ABV6H7D4_9ACTN